MMSAKATYVFVCLLIHCSAYDYDNYPLCNMLVEENVEPLDALNISVFCMNDSLANLTWSNTDKYSLETVHIEYQCYNSTNGEEITETIIVESFSERHDHNTIVYIEELANEDVYCTFTGCVGLSSKINVYWWTMNTQTVNCTFQDRIESSPLNEQPHSSTTTLLLSSVEASLTARAVETDTIVSSSRQPSLVVTKPGITSLIKTTDGSTTTTAVAPSTVDPMLNGFMNHTTADIVWTILLLVLVIIVVIGTIATGIVLLLFNRKMVLKRMATMQQKN